MARICIELRKTVVIETENVNDLTALGVASWFGMSGSMVHSLQLSGVEVVAGTELGAPYAPAPVLEVLDETFVSGVPCPEGKDWKPYPVRVWPPANPPS